MENEAGHRYCQRITEIIPIRDRRYPSEVSAAEEENTKRKSNLNKTLMKDTIEYQKRMTDRQVFEVRDIVVYANGEYRFINMPTDETINAISANLSEEEKVQFVEELRGMWMNPSADTPETIEVAAE